MNINNKLLLNDDYHLPEDDNHHSHCRGNLKSYNVAEWITLRINVFGVY
jgi:hypothetical protein